MKTEDIANRLIELCTAGEFIKAQEELYDTEIISIETDGSRREGLTTMLAKEQNFLDSLVKIDKIEFAPPVIAGSYISVKLMMAVDFKSIGPKSFEEICVYKVVNEKIVFEQFFRD
ncbi:SnoaL-like domain-containing protein [Mucilaginibacter sp. X5P1]|uniref:SnoaL-like domain-containing protein n=1 Tax=Mucilaginibacter sp. X5P1 TaxID=2723088 RepID=UPI00160CB262|nr:SnoaL-like domain-containing protein [Mucilaginibacter sp. X5P1]MBB6142019.1 hypothetical protein [Mucilaginibacter sp. X5P1]